MSSHGEADAPSGRLYLGVDGGGTHTTAVVTDAQGHVLGRGEGGASHAWFEGSESAEAALRSAVAAALEAAEVRGRLSAACLALASCSGPAPAGQQWADLAREVSVEHDAWASLVAAIGPTRPGVVIQAGTGSVVVGRTAAGVRVSRGGWGPLVGDEGSAYGIGAAAFRVAAHAVDHTGAPTLLVDAIADEWHLSWDGIREHLYGPGHRQRLASLAPMVVSLAATDEVARSVVRREVDALARQAAVVIEATLPTGVSSGAVVDVVLSGGVVHPPTEVTTQLHSAVGAMVAAEIRWHQGADAALGAAMLARHQEGI